MRNLRSLAVIAIFFAVTCIPIVLRAAVFVSVDLAPPPLPVYVQPEIPGPGYIWTPGYWAYDPDDGYYWVPGTWVLPPTIGVLWTPPYWGWSDGAYIFHEGYWGPHVGFYGGINYGFGYGGIGFEGGRWEGGGFVYNRTVNNLGTVNITNVYEKNITTVNTTRVSYVGGAGGLKATPTSENRFAAQDRHIPMTTEQTKHIAAAAATPELAARHNDGRPMIVATQRPAHFEGPNVVRLQSAGNGISPAAKPPHPQEHAMPVRTEHQMAAPNHPVEHPAIQPEQGTRHPVGAPMHPAWGEPARPAERHEFISGATPPHSQPHPIQQRPEPRPPQHAQPHGQPADKGKDHER